LELILFQKLDHFQVWKNPLFFKENNNYIKHE
jgi:hypothetical protein